MAIYPLQEDMSTRSQEEKTFSEDSHTRRGADIWSSLGFLADASRRVYCTFQTCTVALRQAEAMRLLSGDHATASTASESPD